MREKACCFTGHRALPGEELGALTEWLEREICRLLEQGCTDFYVGGALGFDTLAAETVLRLRQRFPQLRLLLIVPCATQADRWSARNQQRYRAIREAADEVTVLSKTYTAGCMHRRNRYMVDHSSVCLCYLRTARGGTAYTVRYARGHGCEVRNYCERDVAEQLTLFS